MSDGNEIFGSWRSRTRAGRWRIVRGSTKRAQKGEGVCIKLYCEYQQRLSTGSGHIDLQAARSNYLDNYLLGLRPPLGNERSDIRCQPAPELVAACQEKGKT